MELNGEGIYGTRPWTRAESNTTDGIGVRYTQKGGVLYAFLLGKPAGNSVTIEGFNLNPDVKIDLIGYSQQLKWRNDGENLIILINDELENSPAYLLKIDPIPGK